MKIAIVGGQGQLGADCSSILCEKHQLVSCDLPEVDLARPDTIDNFIATHGPEVIINCAAFTAVDLCESKTELCWQVNADGPAHLAKAATKSGARLIHISTDYVFDGRKTAPEAYKEDDTTNPLSQYGKSKLAGEERVLDHCPQALILRTAWLYSATGANFLKTMLRLAIADPGRELKVVDDQYGSLTWSYTLARQIEKCLTSDICGIAHATSEGYSTWYQAARYFLDKLGLSYSMRGCTTAEYPTPAHRPANSILQNTVLEAKGLSVFVDWRKELDSYLERFGEKLVKEAREQQ